MTRHCSGTLAERKRSAILIWQCVSCSWLSWSRSHPRGQHNGQCVIRGITTVTRLWPGPNPYFQLKMMAERRVTKLSRTNAQICKARLTRWRLGKSYFAFAETIFSDYSLRLNHDIDEAWKFTGENRIAESLKMNLSMSNSFRINFEPNKKLILQIRAKRLNIKDPERPEAVSLVRFPLLCTNRNCITGILRTWYKRKRELNRKG